MAVNCQLLKEILETWAMKYKTVLYQNECQTLYVFLFTGSKIFNLHHLSTHSLSLKTTITPNPSVEVSENHHHISSDWCHTQPVLQ